MDLNFDEILKFTKDHLRVENLLAIFSRASCFVRYIMNEYLFCCAMLYISHNLQMFGPQVVGHNV